MDPSGWFEDLGDAPRLGAPDGWILARAVAAALRGGGWDASALPAHLRADAHPRIVFISRHDGATRARAFVGAARGVLAAIANALARAQEAGGAHPTAVRLDVVLRARPVERTAAGAPELDRRREGLASDRASGTAFLPEELLAGRGAEATGEPRHRFSLMSFYVAETESVRLYGGHRVSSPPTPEGLLEAVRLGGEYLVGATGPDGRFAYVYEADQDSCPDEYNMLRHAGTAYAMLELYEVTREARLLEAAERAIGYLLASVRPIRVGAVEALCLVDEQGDVKLGGNGLASIALAKHAVVTGDDAHVATIRGLARWVQAIQAESGELTIHKQRYADGRRSRLVSDYYPGEAILGLVRGYGVAGDESWLDTAEHAARWLIEVRDGGRADDALSHDHWLLYGLNELYRQRPERRYLRHARRIAGAIVRAQVLRPRAPDYLGSWYDPPRSMPVACRVEGLGVAHELVRDFGDPEEAQTFLASAMLGATFELSTQLRPESAMFLPNPRRAVGGFRKSLSSYEIRIDYVQHNVSALLGLRRNLMQGPESAF